MKLAEILEKEAGSVDDKHTQVDEYGVIRFWINDQHLVHLRSSRDENSFYLYAKVGPLSFSNQVKTYETLLEANLFGEKTGPCVLTIHARSQSVILMRAFESDLTTDETYKLEFQIFIDYLVFWKETLKEMYAKTEKSHENMFNIMSKRNQKIIFI